MNDSLDTSQDGCIDDVGRTADIHSHELLFALLSLEPKKRSSMNDCVSALHAFFEGFWVEDIAFNPCDFIGMFADQIHFRTASADGADLVSSFQEDARDVRAQKPSGSGQKKDHRLFEFDEESAFSNSIPGFDMYG